LPSIDFTPREGFLTALVSGGTFLQFRFVYRDGEGLDLELAQSQQPRRICGDLQAEPLDIRTTAVGPGLTIVLDLGELRRCFVCAVSRNHVPARFDWPADANLRLRVQGEKHLLAFDSSGRILHIALDSSIARHVSLR